MDNPLTPETQNSILEDSLHTYPMAPMPRDITAEVMSRIQTVPAPRSFRLSWNDVLLSMVIAICIGVVWFSLQNLPPLAVAHIRKESILLYQQFLLNARWFIPLLSFVLAGFFAALTIPYWKQELMK